MINDLEYFATQRKTSLFSAGMSAQFDTLDSSIRGSSVCIVGAAGSIGRSVLDCLLQYKPGRLVLIDLSENNLVELVRDLRSSGISLPEDFRILPIDFGSPSFSLFLENEKPFDYFFNLSAIKHVRSEKDEYCIKRLVQTNVLNVHQVLNQLSYKPKCFFSVSSDKAVNPSNIMGASKKVMEDVMIANTKEIKVNFARFANVAFSYGSLPFGFIHRLEKMQPLAGPSDIRRYFISHQEAGQLCVLNGVLGSTGEAYFPEPAEGLPEISFLEIAEKLLSHHGYSVLRVETPKEARAAITEVHKTKAWPCLFTPSETDGEKQLEEFVSRGDTLKDSPVANIGVVKPEMSKERRERAFAGIDWFLENSQKLVGRSAYIDEFSELVDGFDHVSSGKSLDQKM